MSITLTYCLSPKERPHASGAPRAGAPAAQAPQIPAIRCTQSGNVYLMPIHRVFDKTMKETGYKHEYKIFKPHQYDEVIRCESTGQQRKLVRKIY